MSIEAFYLEADTHAGRKFYRCLLKGRFVVAEWGRVGTQGQSTVWQLATPSLAKERFESKRIEKSNSYTPVSDPVPASAYPEHIDRAHREASYELYWFATRPLTSEVLLQAATEADRLLDRMGRYASASVTFHDDTGTASPCGYVEMSAGGRDARFGFPSQAYREARLSAGRPLDAHYVSAEGWLGSDGKGQGVIDVQHDDLDLPVRVFLGRLIAVAGESTFRAEDVFGEALTQWIEPPTASVSQQFAWVAHYADLQRALEAEGWLPGGVCEDARLMIDIGGEGTTVSPLW